MVVMHCPGCRTVFNPELDVLDHNLEPLQDGGHRIYCRTLGKTYRLAGVVEKPIQDVFGEGPQLEIESLKQEVEKLKNSLNERDEFQMTLVKKIREQDTKIERLSKFCNNIGRLLKVSMPSQ